MPEHILLLFSFIFGAVFGSFYNVCIYRLPRSLSVVSPPSSCPVCKYRIPFYLNVPILSFILLRGRCAGCKAPFSILYPFVELLSGLCALALFVRFGLTPALFVYFIFLSALIIITFIDFEFKIIPDVISLPGIIIGFGCSFFFLPITYIDSLIGLLLGGGLLFSIAAGYYLLTKREGMGGGDIKLLAMIGAFIGWQGVIFTLFASSFAGSIIGLLFMALMGKSRRTALPFGPFLALGAVIFLFYGSELIELYLNYATGSFG